MKSQRPNHSSVQKSGCARSSLPVCNEGIRFYAVGDDQIACDGHNRAVVYLNATAQALLKLCDGTRCLSEILAEIASRYGLQADDILGEVASCLGCLAAERLIKIDGSILATLLPPHGKEPLISSIGFGDSVIDIRATDPLIDGEIRQRFRHLLCLPGTGESISLDIISLAGSTERYAYVCNSSTNVNVSQYSVVRDFTYLKSSVVMPLMEMSESIWFHAGGVAEGQNSVIISGLAGCGKSSITTELSRRGWDYLSDEVVVLSLPGLQSLPFPLAPLPRRSAAEFLPQYRLQEIERDVIDVPQEQISRFPTIPKAIFFPAYLPGSEAKLDLLSPGVACTQLLSNCVSLQSRGEQAVKATIELVEHINAWSLSYESIQDACDLIEQAWQY